MTYYLTQKPTFSELAKMCKRIDHTIDLADKPINIVSMETGEVYAIRHQCNMWEVCDHTEELDLDGFDYDRIEGKGKSTDAVADEISANLQALVGTADEPAPKAEPRHPINETTTSKFANLQFGRNYDHGTGR